MKRIGFLLSIALTGCIHHPMPVIAPSTALVKSGIDKASSSVDEAQTANQQGLDAITRAELTTMSLKEKLELLKAFDR